MARNGTTERQALWQPGEVEEDRHFHESDWHLHLVYDEEEVIGVYDSIQIPQGKNIEPTILSLTRVHLLYFPPVEHSTSPSCRQETPRPTSAYCSTSSSDQIAGAQSHDDDDAFSPTRYRLTCVHNN